MFPVDQLARFEVNNPTHRLLKPWWDVCTDYLASAILFIAVLSGAMQATQGNLVCLPAVDCNFERNQSMKAPGNNSFCRSYDYLATRSSTMTVLIKLKDRRQYDFVEAECGQEAVHWFASYFPLIIFGQAMILIIVKNFWLKFPHTSSILEHFVTLVIECYNTPGTSLALSNTLWGTSISDSTKSASLKVSEAIKAKTLHEKARHFCIDVEKKQGLLTLRWIYVFQAITQLVLSLLFLIINACFHSKLNKTVKCDIEDHISENYNYFKCSNVVVSYFQVTLVIFYVLIVPYFLSCIFICVWTISKMKKTYDFKKEHTKNRQPQSGGSQLKDYILPLSDLRPASGDLAFMLYLLDEYDKLYSLRLAVFLSKKNEKKVNELLLLKEWPIEKLRRNTEDGGRKLKLTTLHGIPKTVFEMKELDSLILENCTLNADDDFEREDWLNLHGLKSLSLITCCLTSIPTAILKLSSLETLDLSLNNISSIPVEVSRLEDLDTLNIASNKVTKGVEHIIAMENLKVLNLRKNNSLQLRLPQCQPTLMRLYVDTEMVAQMTVETKETLRNVIETKVPHDISVMQYSPNRAPHIEQERRNTQNVYKMTSKRKGLALIMTLFDYNIFFDNMEHLKNDVEKLEKLFDGIGYQVITVPQDSFMTVKIFLDKISTLLNDNVNCDSLILVIMARGNKDGMYIEKRTIVTLEQIIEILQIDSLHGKPKLVFIQSGFNHLQTDPVYQPVLVKENKPYYSDVLLHYSFLQRHASHRNTQHGSWFFDALVKVFSKYAWEEDVLRLFTYVNYEVSRKLNMKCYKQISAPQSTLTKKLFFLPGYFEDD